MSKAKLLLAAVFGPYGIKDEYADEIGCQMELLNNQVTRAQGVHSPRQSYWSYGLYLMAENISVPTVVLDFPTWDDFIQELKKGYTHVGISFIAPNVLKAGRMARYIREHYPQTKIILGGYGASLPDIQESVPHDEVCLGEGVRWLRKYFGEDPEAPLKHPALDCLAYEYIYGYPSTPRGSVLMPGLGCENGCTFCCTSHKYEKCYVPLLKNGKEVYDACVHSADEKRTAGFIVLDENFLKRPQRARELLAEMEAHNKPFVFDVFSSANTIQELGVDFLVRLGVRTVWIGVESKTYDHAKKKDIDLHPLIEELQDKGIIVLASLILFLEHHDKLTIQEDIDWVISLKTSLVQFMNFTPFPGTTLHNSLQAEGRLKNVPSRHLHGAGQLFFSHPHFPDPKDHADILCKAFKQKYEADGPAILNMAMTSVKGYDRARKDFEQRRQEGLAWNPETLHYEKSDSPKRDQFMKRRIFMMGGTALMLRPTLVPAWVFAPNSAARKKASEAIRLYNQIYGKPKLMDHLRSAALVVTGTIELTRTWFNKLLGRESIVRQPRCLRTKYRLDEAFQYELKPLTSPLPQPAQEPDND